MSQHELSAIGRRFPRGWAIYPRDTDASAGIFRCTTPGCDFWHPYHGVEEFMAIVDEHYERAHEVRAPYPDYLPLTANDRKWLEGLRISAD